MKRIIHFFIDRPVWGNAAIVIVVMFGLFSMLSTNKSFFPEQDPNRIIVSVTYPGASPVEMEDGITIKIEQAIKGLAGIDEINSTSQENFCQVTITRSEEHTSELQSHNELVCGLLLEKKNTKNN